jgi:leucine dehydrogenase
MSNKGAMGTYKPADQPHIQKLPEGLLIELDLRSSENRAFIRDAYGYEAENRGWCREADRFFAFSGALSQDQVRKKLASKPPPGVLEVSEPPRPAGQLAQPFFALEDGTEVTWIRHPAALPEACRSHWRNHMSLFVIKNTNPNFTAYTSIYSYASLDGEDGKFRIFGPGGIRWIDYPDQETAISDALDMSLAVAMKIQVVRTPNGGNKIAVIGDKKDKDRALRCIFTAYEKMGLIVTSADLGLSLADLERSSLDVAPTTIVPMGAFRDGTPSALVTADASFAGLEAMAESLPGSPDLSACFVSIQGLGEVGFRVAQYLIERGSRLVMAETNPEIMEAMRSENKAAFESGQVRFVEEPDGIYDEAVDIFFPCALRDILTERNLQRLLKAGVKIIGGPANNLFPDQVTGPWAYHRAGLPVVPYEGIGAGGVTGVAYSVMSGVFGQCPFTIGDKVSMIRDYVAKVLDWSRRYNLPPQVVSDRLLFNSTQRRRSITQERCDEILTLLQWAFAQPDRELERQLVLDYSKKGLFYGSGRHPNGGWKYL